MRYSAPPDAPPELVVRIPRPAREWWEDVVETCTHIRTFCSADHVTEPAGLVVELERLYRLPPPWDGGRLDPRREPKPPPGRPALPRDVGPDGPVLGAP